jgi:glycyl-tRNA synthetase
MSEPKTDPELMDKIVSLCKRRGFVFPGSEIYGGLANSWDYGPLGVELKNNLRDWWWKRFVQQRDDMVGIDAAILMNPRVWEASGHLKEFSDPLVECKNCHNRFRVDKLIEDESGKSIGLLYSEFRLAWIKDILQKYKQATRQLRKKSAELDLQLLEKEEELLQLGIDPDEVKKNAKRTPEYEYKGDFNTLKAEDAAYKKMVAGGVAAYLEYLLENNRIPCSNCGKYDFSKPKNFNLMFQTSVGTTEESSSTVYLRPEIAQAMFVNFKNVLDTMRKRLPFGIASVGKAFRNEITPGNFIFRTLEFDLMEFEYFIREGDWEKQFDYWLQEQQDWLSDMGFGKDRLRIREHDAGERAHYSKKTADVEYKTPFGWKEMFGLAYRTDFDLKQHMEKSGINLEYTDPETAEKFVPHVIEPTFGLTRLFLMVLLESYREEGEGNDKRVYLKLHPKLAPYKVAVFPLLKNKPELVEKAKGIYNDLRKDFTTIWDDRGNVGKRYYSQDEIGTPFCITVDFDTLEDNAVTVRDRDTAKQERVAIGELQNYISKRLQ